jgi:hypothetical protein
MELGNDYVAGGMCDVLGDDRMGTLARWEDSLCSLLQEKVTHEKLMDRARQIPRVRTNPASYAQGELDMPITGEFHD